AGEELKRYGVGLHFRKREARDRVEATLAPPELLRQEQVREPLSGTGSESEVERGRQEQGVLVGPRSGVPTPPEHIARAVPRIPDHDRVPRVSLGESVPRRDGGGAGGQDLALAGA